MGNWISVFPRATSALLVIILLSQVLFATASRSLAQAQSNAGSYSGVYFQERGLDTAGNPIDKLISRFGFSCLTEPGSFYRPCRIESGGVR
jgi:hypothetical protein